MSKRLLGIGDVYTYDYKQVHKTRNVGFGYYDPNKVSTTSSTDGYVLVDGVLSVVNEDGSSKPEPTPPAPPWEEVKIGDQTWADRNLAYSAEGIKYIGYSANYTVNGIDLGEKYFYTTGAVQQISGNFPGWHIPTQDDVELLMNQVDNDCDSLRTTSGWNDGLNGNNLYGFNGEPLGRSNKITQYVDLGRYCGFWYLAGNSIRNCRLSSDNTFTLTTANITAAFPIRLIKD